MRPIAIILLGGTAALIAYLVAKRSGVVPTEQVADVASHATEVIAEKAEDAAHRAADILHH